MIALVRNNLSCLISKQNSSFSRSNASLSLLLHYFSTSPEREAVDTAAVYNVLVNKHYFSPDFASSVSSGLNRLRSPEKADSILSFLEENGFSSTQLQRIVKPDLRILTASVEDDIKLKIKILKDFGFSPVDIAKITTANQAILHSSTEKKIIPQLSTLEGLFGSKKEVIELVKREGWYLKNNFVPNLELLKSSGVDMEGIRVLLHNFPRCLLLKHDKMRRSVEKAIDIGVDQSSKSFVFAIRVLVSLKEETWELKLQGFRDLGFSESDVMAMFRKVPVVLATSMEKVTEITKILLATGRFDMSDMINDPTTLLCSIEKRFKPRLQVLEILESKKLIKKWPTLSVICRYSHVKFYEKFVRPYSDNLGEVISMFEDEREKKE